MLPFHLPPPPDWVRVDVVDHPQAIFSSEMGSVLREPPNDNINWRWESMAFPDSETLSNEVTPDNLLQIMNAHQWHDTGYLGQGVKIAVFDIGVYGAAESSELPNVVLHDCFAHKSCLPTLDFSDSSFEYSRSKHGIACAEVIRDMAPEAELHLVRIGGLTSLENGINWAISEGIDIISMSMSFFNESFYDGSGPVSALVSRLAANNILLVASAGNYATKHHSGSYHDPDLDGFHEFEHGSTYLPIYFDVGEHQVYLTWDQFENCGETDLDGYIWSKGGALAGHGLRRQSENCRPYERIRVKAVEEGWKWLQIKRHRGSANVQYKVVARTGRIYHNHSRGSIADPGSHGATLTVGAVRAWNYSGNHLEEFSSSGPTSAGLTKPDIAGPNGLSVQSYGPYGFFGTSAATPAVAGAVALIMSKNKEMSPYQAATTLKNSALPMVANGNASSFDGPGLARLPAPGERSGCAGFFGFFPAFLLWARIRVTQRVNCQKKLD